MRPRLATLAAALLAAGPLAATPWEIPPDWVFVDPLSSFGALTSHGTGAFAIALGSAGDVNGDGLDDLLTTDCLRSSPSLYEGVALIFHGAPAGPAPGPDASLATGFDLDAFGIAAAPLGDFDGDGFADIAIGSVNRGPGAPGLGRVDVFRGSAVGPSFPADHALAGTAPQYALGHALAALDADGDGQIELAVGCRGCVGPAGPAFPGAILLHRVTSAGVAPMPFQTIWETPPREALGHTLVAAGDTNGDGRDDLLAAEYTASGIGGARPARVRLFLGNATGLENAPAWVLELSTGFTGLGRAVAAGDVNGDGLADVIIGEAGFNDPVLTRAGRVSAYLGSPAGLSATPAWSRLGTRPWQGFGLQVAAADVNGDGLDDVIVTTDGDPLPGLTPGRRDGGTLVFLSSPSGIADEPAAMITTPAGWTAAPPSGRVGPVGDINGDGAEDWAVAATTARENAPGEGAVALILGKPWAVTALFAGSPAASSCREATISDASVSGANYGPASFEWTASDPAVSLTPASGDVPPGPDGRLLPPVLAVLAGDPCGRETWARLTVRAGASEWVAETTLRFDDRTPPALSGVPADATAPCDAVPPLPASPPTATDDCDPAPTVALFESTLPGRCPGERTILRTWTATDACGNAASATQAIQLVDDVAPAILPSRQVIATLWPPNHGMVAVPVAALAPVIVEACSEPVTWRVVACVSSQPDDATGDGATSGDCYPSADGLAILARAERQGGARAGRTYEISITARDACGNESLPTVAGVILVPHDRRP